MFGSGILQTVCSEGSPVSRRRRCNGTADNNVVSGGNAALILVFLTAIGKKKRRAELRDWSAESATCVCECVFRVRAGV